MIKNQPSNFKMRPWYMAVVVVFAIALFGFSTEQADEATADSTTHVWIDLVTPDLEQSKNFYGKLLGWTYSESNHNGIKNVLIHNGSRTIGSMYEVDKADASAWIPAAPTNSGDLRAKSESLLKKDAKVALKTMSVPGRGLQIVMEGPQGEEFSLISDNNYIDPNTSSSASGNWMGAELWASDVTSARSFYEFAFNANLIERQYQGKPYWFFEINGKQMAGMIQNPISNQSTQWVPYVYFRDPASLASQVESMGGHVIAAPSPKLRNGNLAIIQDPSGAILCVNTSK